MNTTNNNRLEILVLDRKNGNICTEYIDVPSLISYLGRSTITHRLQVVAIKGEKSIYFHKLDPSELVKKITEFQNQQ